MIKKLIANLKMFWGKLTKKYVKKQSMLGKDVVLGKLHKIQVANLVVGVKVVTHEGIANIKELKPKNWVVVSYPTGRTVEHKVTKLYQYYFQIRNVRNNTMHMYPLSYSDYTYIHPDEEDVWLEGHITKKKYFKLIEDVIKERECLPIFHTKQGGKHILRELERKGLIRIKK